MVAAASAAAVGLDSADSTMAGKWRYSSPCRALDFVILWVKDFAYRSLRVGCAGFTEGHLRAASAVSSGRWDCTYDFAHNCGFWRVSLRRNIRVACLILSTRSFDLSESLHELGQKHTFGALVTLFDCAHEALHREVLCRRHNSTLSCPGKSGTREVLTVGRRLGCCRAPVEERKTAPVALTWGH